MTSNAPQAIFLKDYLPPDFLIDETHLNFQLGEAATTVSARLKMRRNPLGRPDAKLILDGRELDTRQVVLNGRTLGEGEFRIESEQLSILMELPERFELESVVMIKPQLNTSLEGLYKSRTMFCTQCEAEGFRKITW